MPVAKPKTGKVKGVRTTPITRREVRKVAKVFKGLIDKKIAERRQAERTLRPDLFKKMDKLTPQMLADILGAKPEKMGGGYFTLADLRRFDDARKKAAKGFDYSSAGAPLYQLLSSSVSIDKHRAKDEIKNTVLYRIKFNELFFRVTAGPNSNVSYHQVRVRLEEWPANLAGGNKCLSSVKKACEGRISFDCDCGRHQFWYRYIATVGGFAIKPYEFSFPKIRNPQLKGCCCKHVIKTLYALRSPSIHNLLSKEMSRQADTIGFGADKKRSRYLSQEELEKAHRAHKDSLSDKDIQKKIDLRVAKAAKIGERKKVVKTKLRRQDLRGKESEKLKKLELEKETYRGIAKKEVAGRKEAERKLQIQSLATQMAVHLAKAIYVDKKNRADAVKEFADKGNIPIADAREADKLINL